MNPAQFSDRPKARSYTNIAAFVLGVPLAVGLLTAINVAPAEAFPYKRYVENPVEVVEVVLFCCALGGLGAKAFANLGQRAACRRELLPFWDGNPIPASDAPRLRAGLEECAGRLRNSLLARRLDAVLDFVSKRGTADGLDDQIRALADTDAAALDTSYTLIRFITWAIPILGFLGTVLGITKAIAGVTPEALEKSLSGVTEGLSLAFDTTAVGLALTMVTMFLSFLTERLEQSVLEHVDHVTDVQLAHRFERAGGEHGGFLIAARQNTRILLEATEKLVQQQASIWANALAAAQQQWADGAQRQQQQIAIALEEVLEKTVDTHMARMSALEQQVENQSGALLGQMTTFANALRELGREHQESLAHVIDAVTAQTDALTRLQHDGKQLIQLQDVLHQNLAALQGAGAFDEAVQSLTAAIHLLTAKVSQGSTGSPSSRFSGRPGAAA